MKFNVSKLPADFKEKLAKFALHSPFEIDENGVVLTAEKSDNAGYERGENSLKIRYNKVYEFFYSLKRSLEGNKTSENIKCRFDEFGVMLECSRNAVKKVDSVKDYLDHLALMGYNQLQLYTEDTYEIEGEPYFGYMRGRYSIAELKEIDSYARSYDIEVVPCVQTFAHLNQAFRWKRFKDIRDIDDILLAGDERTYEFIDRMFASLAKAFTSRKIHLGMDEAHNVGRGKYRDLFGNEKGHVVLLRHLRRVLDIAHKYGFECMMWSDMFFRLQFNGNARPTPDMPQLSKEIIDLVPKDVSLVYWDYYQLSREMYDNMIERHQKFGNEIVFAGGAWCWHGFAPHIKFSEKATGCAFESCINHKIKRVFLTTWGDDGAECSPFALYSAFSFGSDIAYGDKKHEKSLYALTKMKKSDVLALDSVNDIEREDEHVECMSKVALYNDPFIGTFDPVIDESKAEKFKEITRKIHSAKLRAGKYAYLFDTLEKLSSVLEIKYALGVKTRRLYKAGDKKALEKLVKEDYLPLIKRLEKFYAAFAYQWEKENKPFGFEIQDIRLGGLIQRVKHCAKSLTDYSSGKLDKIAELEEELLAPDMGGNPRSNNRYIEQVSPAVISMNVL